MNKFIIPLLVILITACCGSKQEKVDRIIEDGVEIVFTHLDSYKISDISSFSLEEIFKIDI